MNRFFGKIGYGETQEDPAGSGVWVDLITEFPYYGDVVRNTRALERGEDLNPDIAVGEHKRQWTVQQSHHKPQIRQDTCTR